MTEESTVDTVEVDPDELSDEVAEDLVEEGALDEEMAEEYGDEVWFGVLISFRKSKLIVNKFATM